MKIFSSSIIYFLSFTIFMQSALFGSGLFAYFLQKQAVYCSCNHSSKKEIHTSDNPNKEDHEFHRKNSSRMKLMTDDLNLPDCHKAKAGETHLCSCKKSKKAFETTYSQVSAFYILLHQNPIFRSDFLYSYFLPIRMDMPGSAHDLQLLKPPRV
ncbi:MAG: hypothetical protein K8R21_09175 [Leptospira sp.]|nr:hypothetical protein [Leptospira sp.]